MNYNELLLSYINEYPLDEPIFIEDIKKYFKKNINDTSLYEKTIKKIYVYINRLVKKSIILQYIKGIYYKPSKGMFGIKPLNPEKVIAKKYLIDENGFKGFYTGAALLNKVGLSTQVPNEVYIITNECPNNNEYYNKQLKVTIKKPKIPVTNENYLYLQLFEILNNADEVNNEIEDKQLKAIVHKYMEEFKIEAIKLLELAKQTNNKKAILKLYEME